MLVDSTSDIEETKMQLLDVINHHRASQGKPPLADYPVGCSSFCGETAENVGSLAQGFAAFVFKCRQCTLEPFPFNKLRLALNENPMWSGSNHTFHRTSDYGILLSDQAVYLYSPFFLMFSRWRRLPLHEVLRIEFRDSKLFPSLRITHSSGVSVLRTPLDYADEMDFDRGILNEAVKHVSQALCRP